MVRYVHLLLAIVSGFTQVILAWFGGLFLVSHFELPGVFELVAFYLAFLSLCWPMILYNAMNVNRRRLAEIVREQGMKEEQDCESVVD